MFINNLMSLTSKELYLYIEMDIYCLIILLMLLLKNVLGKNKIKHQYDFNYVTITSMALCIVDIVKTYIGNKVQDEIVISLCYALYYILISVIGYNLFRYFAKLVHFKTIGNIYYRFIFSIPVIGSIITLAASGINNAMIEFGIAYMIVYGFMLLNLSIYVTRVNKTYLDRIKFILFPSIPLICIILHIIDFRISVVLGLVVSCIVTYVYSIELLISTDSLTNINNRKNLLSYINHKIRYIEECDDLYVMMIDADNFKQINDTYGHTEGDKCLIRLADTIRHACGKLPKRSFICRYGGDEFAIVADCTKEDIEALEKDIYEDLKIQNKKDNCEYEFNISIGISRYSEYDQTAIDIINSADDLLYIKKRNKK